MEYGFIEYWIKKLNISEKELRGLLCAIDYDGYITPQFEIELKEYLKKRG